MEPNDQIITWLRDAHAMEQSIENTLARHLKDAVEFPDVRARLEQHLAETHGHAARIRSCLESLGETPSTIKSAAGGLMGMMQGMASGMFADEPVKNLLMEYAMEHLEIAAYTSLIAAADEAGLVEVTNMCSEILREEVSMATWLEARIPDVTRSFMQHSMMQARGAASP